MDSVEIIVFLKYFRKLSTIGFTNSFNAFENMITRKRANLSLGYVTFYDSEPEETINELSNNNNKIPQDWRSTKLDINEKLHFALNKQLYTDVVFLVGKGDKQQEFKAHRLILSLASEVFEAMFYGHMANTESKEKISLPDIEPEVFLTILHYIYADEIRISLDSVIGTIYAAKKYILPQLVEECTLLLKQNINNSNILIIYEQARFFDIGDLVTYCLGEIDQRILEIIQSEDILSIQLDTLLPILKRNQHHLKENELWDTLYRWAKHQCLERDLKFEISNIRLVLGEATQLISDSQLTTLIAKFDEESEFIPS